MEDEKYLLKVIKTRITHQIKRCLRQGKLNKRKRRKYYALLRELNTPIEVKNITIKKQLTEYSKRGTCVSKTREILHCAIKQGNLDIIRFILEQYPGFSINDTNFESLKPLYTAVENKKINVLRYLLNKGANVNAYCKYKQSPLYIAATLGSVEMVNLLLEYNAKINVCDKGNVSPLYRAIFNGHTEVAKVLIRAGTDLNENGLVWAAIKVGMTEIVEDLVQHGANIFQDNLLVQEATEANNLEVIKILHRAGVLLTNVDHDGNTDLMNACYDGQLSIVEYMLKNGVSPNTINETNDMTALHFCIDQNQNSACYRELSDELEYPDIFEKFLELFVQYDAILEQKSSKGENIFSYALGFFNFKVLRMLVKYGFDVKCIEETWVNTILTKILSHKVNEFIGDECIPEKLDDLNDLVKLVFCAGFEFKNEVILKDLDDGRISKFIVHSMSRPRSLKDLCRIRIRKLLGKKVMIKLYKLPLPQCMHDFLAFDIL